MASAWVNHVMNFAKKHKIKYGEALRNAQCKSEYKKTGTTNTKSKKGC